MRSVLVFIFLSISLLGVAQNSHGTTKPDSRITRSEYIERYAPFAVKEMLISGVPASITLAQGILESGDGNSLLAREAKNHFGIKCHGMWEGRKFYKDDDAKNECFRVYESVFDSYRDHSEFLSGRGRYAALFELRRTDYKGWAHGLKKAGYATNPKYPALLIRIIEENDLTRFDRMKKPPADVDQQPEETKSDEQQPPKEDVDPKEAIVSSLDRQMYLRNNIRFVRAKKGDTYKKLEYLLGVRRWQILKYNDKQSNPTLRPGEILYLQPKRRRNRDHDFHFTQRGETLRSISQKYGIKLKKLYKYNELNPGEEPIVGQKVWLRRKRRRDY